MQRWAWIVVLLYGVIAILLTWPVLFLGFIKTETKVNILATFSSWTYWAWLTVMLLSQAALLAVPVKIAERRPVTRQAIISSVLGGAFMMGILILGAVASIGETIAHDSLYKPIWYAALIELVLMWILWAVIFFRWSKRLEPRTLVEKTAPLDIQEQHPRALDSGPDARHREAEGVLLRRLCDVRRNSVRPGGHALLVWTGHIFIVCRALEKHKQEIIGEDRSGTFSKSFPGMA